MVEDKSPQKYCIVISGPTAVGKTSVAIQLAQHFKTEIISADSRQCYKEMSLGVARPSESDLNKIPHHFIASYSIHQEVNAKTFEEYALEALHKIFQKHNIAIVVGGTGLYLKALMEGLDHIPPIKKAVREFVREGYDEKGLSWLHDQLKEHDQEYFQKGEINNPARCMRALEVILDTKKSILNFQEGVKASRDFNIIQVGLSIEKALLHQNIHQRVDQMFSNGLVEEVRSLFAHKNLKALQTVGYSEVFDLLEGKRTEEDAKAEIKKNTRRYAKRQMTWFKKVSGIEWFEANSGLAPILEYLQTNIIDCQS